jgi:hypothetical protein
MGIGSKEMYKSELSGFCATLSLSELLFTSPVGLHNRQKLGRSGRRELMVGQVRCDLRSRAEFSKIAKDRPA